MKINVLQQLTDFSGKPIETAPQTCPQCGQPVGDREVLTLRAVGINALLAVRPDQKTGAEEKIRRYALAQRIYEEDELDLSVQEIGEIQNLVNTTYASPLVVAQTWRMLEAS